MTNLDKLPNPFIAVAEPVKVKRKPKSKKN